MPSDRPCTTHREPQTLLGRAKPAECSRLGQSPAYGSCSPRQGTGFALGLRPTLDPANTTDRAMPTRVDNEGRVIDRLLPRFTARFAPRTGPFRHDNATASSPTARPRDSRAFTGTPPSLTPPCAPSTAAPAPAPAHVLAEVRREERAVLARPIHRLRPPAQLLQRLAQAFAEARAHQARRVPPNRLMVAPRVACRPLSRNFGRTGA